MGKMCLLLRIEHMPLGVIDADPSFGIADPHAAAPAAAGIRCNASLEAAYGAERRRSSSLAAAFRFVRKVTTYGVSFMFALGTAASAESYDATVSGPIFHGFLNVVAKDCHHHNLSDSRTITQQALFAWGAAKYNVHIESHTNGHLEQADEIWPRTTESVLVRCEKQTLAFNSQVDGTIASWSEGQAIGSFEVITDAGARRTFSISAGKEPPINGRRLYCGNAPDLLCADFSRVVRLNVTKVRVVYKLIDSPDGAYTNVVRIQTL